MNEVEEIKIRNKRVELDKAWEISKTRRGVIVAVTYIVAVLWLFIIENEKPLLNALIPCGGYLFSTLSLQTLKRWWIRKNSTKQADPFK